MKRIILLLLVLIYFQNSYGEELSAEKQQLAWKFIYENMLSKDYLPRIFKKDIIIKLKGEITAEDSIVVKDLIKNFQMAIPHLKIELSNKQGNFTFGMNVGKNHTFTTHTYVDNILSSTEMLFTDSLTNSKRKQSIYYQLFRGLVSYDKTQQELHRMNGCVFVEKEFRSITFSPFDLFILEKIYSPDFPILLAKNLPPEEKETAWNSIRTKFLGETKEPIIYKEDIAIKLEGSATNVDSACMNELISQLKLTIPNRKIFLTSEKANLVFNILQPGTGNPVRSSTRRINNTIQFKQFDLFFPPNMSREAIKRTFYFNLMRSLVDFSPSRDNSTAITGSVYDENKPENITYTPVDAFILNTLYADDFHEQFKNQFIQQFSYRLYLVHMYHNELNSIFFLLGLLISAIFLTKLLLNGAFKPHNWSWKEYNKQGLFLIAIYSIYSLCIGASDLQIHLREFSLLLLLDLKALIGINLMFFIERFILKNRHLGSAKIIVIFLITLVVMTISLFQFTISYEESGRFINSFTSKESFLNILLFSLVRSLYIFLNDRYKSIINQKDVELAQMGELHKQAELQSLRAKINPHFLYNALNSIASLATTDGRKTEQMALSLSDFFKYSINREQKQLNTLSEELNAIRTYLEIEKVRFGERLSFEIDCPVELLDIQIPQLLIQPLVENAIKHGLSQITQNGLIRIAVSKTSNQLKIRVYDNGPAFTDGPLTGFGIQNTQERIGLLYGPKATINWQNGEEKYIEINLPVDL